MKTLAAFYFSGTGNTKFIAEKLCKKLSGVYATELFDITAKSDFTLNLKQADVILLAFPIYGSAPPIPMREFVHRYKQNFSGKSVIIAETQYFYSGDGAASIGRTIEKSGGKVIAAEHFNMPNNLSDCKIFPIRNGVDCKKTLSRAEKRMDAFVKRILRGKVTKRGFSVFSHAVGYYTQRIFWRKGEPDKRKQLKINELQCIGCGVCARNCPVDNLKMENGKAAANIQCVMCYRCVNLCPRRAITLIGSSAPEKQYKGPRTSE